MRIDSVRLGFATNSSSTHSVIFLSGAKDHAVEDQEFGWDFFTAASRTSKRAYLAQLIRTALRHQVGDEIACIVAKEMAGVEVVKDGNVDHQSNITIPRGFDGNGIDRAFLEDLRTFLDREDVVILGGNDNDEASHPLADAGERASGWGRLWKESQRNEIVTRKDGPYWVLFDRTTGAKTRMTFDHNAPPYTKAARPELVDVKITDFCPFGCSYCYQDSHTRGAHASKDWLWALAHTFGEMGVFEVAIGGGEPTLHPDFLSILRSFRANGVVPSFTTRNLSFIRDAVTASEAAESVRAFAISVDGEGNLNTRLDDIFSAWKNSPLHKAQLTLQYVIGTAEDHVLGWIIERCSKENVPLLLLGYKTVGRGSSYLRQTKETQVDRWMEIVEKAQDGKGFGRIAIDTALADRSKKLLEAKGVPKILYSVREGDFSMYIDAVAKTAAPSSFSDPTLTIRLQDEKIFDSSVLETAFQRF